MGFFSRIKTAASSAISTLKQGVSNVTTSVKQGASRFVSNIKSRFSRGSTSDTETTTQPTLTTQNRPSIEYTYNPYTETGTDRIQIQQTADIAMEFFAENGIDFDRDLLEAKLDQYPGLMDLVEDAIYYHEYEEELESYGYISPEDKALSLANLIIGKN